MTGFSPHALIRQIAAFSSCIKGAVYSYINFLMEIKKKEGKIKSFS